MAMKRVVAATALALFGLAPAVGSACEYDKSAATTAPPAQLALAPVPAASKAPASTVVKGLAPKAAEQDSGKIKEPASDAKVVVGSTN
jgi:hypothetical protein